MPSSASQSTQRPIMYVANRAPPLPSLTHSLTHALSQATVEGYVNEIKLLRKLRGRDEIVRLIDDEVDGTRGVIYLVLEFGEIDFSKLLQQLQKKIANRANFIRVYWQQMLLAVEVIHKEMIVHGGMWWCIRDGSRGAHARILSLSLASHTRIPSYSRRSQACQLCVLPWHVASDRLWHRQGHRQWHDQYRARPPGRNSQLRVARGSHGRGRRG